MTASLAVGQRIALASGRSVVLGERTSGGSKNETRYGWLSDGQSVIVKVERTHGHLGREADALRFLDAHSVRVPRVIELDVDQPVGAVLVLTREQGIRANDAAGWSRFGRALAGLCRIDASGAPVPVVRRAKFVAEHRQRLIEVEDLVGPGLRGRIAHAIDSVEAMTGSLVFTHGDPGTGNYLDDGGEGTLLDWETASISPLGLDLGRGAFIALLDLGGDGHPIQLSDALVRAYRDALSDRLELDGAMVRDWTTIGGLQFVHGRFTQPLRADRTPEIAVGVLGDFLARQSDG